MNEKQRLGEEIIDLNRRRAAIERQLAEMDAELREKRERLASICREESRARCSTAGEAA